MASNSKCSILKPRLPQMTEAEAADLMARIPSYADQHRELIRNAFDFELNFGADSIPTLDEIIEAAWPGGPPALLDEVILGFGSYLGESIRKIHGGNWRFEAEHGLFLDVGGKNLKIFPFAMIHHRLINGPDDSLANYYSMVRGQVEEANKVMPAALPEIHAECE